MVAFKRLAGVMEYPAAYRLWQAPFARAKFAPVERQNDLTQVRRVLDVGCGPGTNAPLFRGLEYVGLDLNPRYLATARRRFSGRFIHADVRSYTPAAGERFDFILLNSLLHHLSTIDVERLLEQLPRLLSPGGHVHILDLVLPEERNLARMLALSDRGDYPRPLEEWRELFSCVFREIHFERYRVGWLRATFWNMVYFKGEAKP